MGNGSSTCASDDPFHCVRVTANDGEPDQLWEATFGGKNFWPDRFAEDRSTVEALCRYP